MTSSQWLWLLYFAVGFFIAGSHLLLIPDKLQFRWGWKTWLATNITIAAVWPLWLILMLFGDDGGEP